MLDCAHFHPGLARIVYSSASVGSTSYLVVYAEIASQVEHRQGADQRYFTVYAVTARTVVTTIACIDSLAKTVSGLYITLAYCSGAEHSLIVFHGMRISRR